MKTKYRMFRRGRSGIYYWQSNDDRAQGSLATTDKVEAQRLLNAKNETHRQPILNLALAKVYLAAHDPEMVTRPWQAVMDEIATHGIETTRARCSRAFRQPAYDPLRDKPLVQTTGADLLEIMRANGNCVSHYLRRLHNRALDVGWLAWPILPKGAWPKIRTIGKRAIRPEEHAIVVASEQNLERRAYYQFLYETGAAQTDGARMTAEQIDWVSGILVYRRQKLGPDSRPARLTIGRKLRALLESLPRSGPLFPNISRLTAENRSAEFRRRCRVAGLSGVSLHSYRYAWAQRAKAAGYPQRFAQAALGHTSRAVHEAYAAGADVICPALDEFERAQANIIAFPSRS